MASEPEGASFGFRTELAASPEDVWRHASTMGGVNRELRPFVRLTCPRGPRQQLEAGDAGAFASWVVLAGVLPVDRHRFRFEDVIVHESFTESSRSWLHRSWVHHRTVIDGPSPGSSIIEDRVWIGPRVRVLGPLVRRGARAAFAHRHRRLRSLFAGSGTTVLSDIDLFHL